MSGFQTEGRRFRAVRDSIETGHKHALCAPRVHFSRDLACPESRADSWLPLYLP
jgi:hypothetical protein